MEDPTEGEPPVIKEPKVTRLPLDPGQVEEAQKDSDRAFKDPFENIESRAQFTAPLVKHPGRGSAKSPFLKSER